MFAKVLHHPGQQNGNGAFGAIKESVNAASALLPVRKDIGRADITGTICRISPSPASLSATGQRECCRAGKQGE